jgi:hypothetical protein
MAVFCVLDCAGAQGVWDFIVASYCDIAFKCETCGANGRALSRQQDSDPYVVQIDDNMQDLFREQCRGFAMEDRLSSDADLPAWLGWTMLHEVAHHRLGHTSRPCNGNRAAEERDANDWARRQYLQMMGKSPLPEVSKVKMAAFLELATKTYEAAKQAGLVP